MKKQEMQATKLSKEMIDNIKHYSENIKTLDEFVDSVRKNPGQYISAIGDEGFMNCIREIFQIHQRELYIIKRRNLAHITEFLQKLT